MSLWVCLFQYCTRMDAVWVDSLGSRRMDVMRTWSTSGRPRNTPAHKRKSRFIDPRRRGSPGLVQSTPEGLCGMAGLAPAAVLEAFAWAVESGTVPPSDSIATASFDCNALARDTTRCNSPWRVLLASSVSKPSAVSHWLRQSLSVPVSKDSRRSICASASRLSRSASRSSPIKMTPRTDTTNKPVPATRLKTACLLACSQLIALDCGRAAAAAAITSRDVRTMAW